MHTDAMARERQFNMRLSDDEVRRLDALADHYGVNAANLVRMLLRREAIALGIDAPAKAGGKAKAKTKRGTR
jgi:hypothetical protein